MILNQNAIFITFDLKTGLGYDLFYKKLKFNCES